MSQAPSGSAGKPVGVIKWETGQGITLTQLEQMPGNIMHPESFSFPIVFKDVKGANFTTLIERFDPGLVKESIRSAAEPLNRSQRASTTSA